MGGSTGRGGIVPFRAGDWKCGNEGCGYHNFAKNVSCLRCGASRQNAAVVAEGAMNTYTTSTYGGPPPGGPNMSMPGMNTGNYGAVAPASSGYDGTGMSGGYSGQAYGQPSTYALPSGLGAPSPYMTGGYSQMASNGGMPSQGGFDSRAEQAFNQGGSNTAGAAGGYSNGGYGGAQYGSGDGNTADPFSFLSSGMNQLAIGDREPRNGQSNTKSPQ